MAGCFGNHPYDRQLERETMRYCDGMGEECPEELAEEIERLLIDKKDSKDIKRKLKILMEMSKASGCCAGCDGCDEPD